LQQAANSRIIALARQLGVLRPRDVEAAGVPREYLLRLMRNGVLERSGRGLYRLPDAPVTEHHSFAIVGKRLPNATICLLSALVFHELTTQNPSEVWVALPPGTHTPVDSGQRLRVVRFSDSALVSGREQHVIEGVPVAIYSAAKTVADCFKFRNKIGLDVALEALRESVRTRKATIREIHHFAGICRVARVMQPYLESL
jgi:predicted transcriptional regulator of viral defense system